MPEDTVVRQLPSEAARLAAIIRARLPDLRERYGVASLALFGSYVRGEQHEGSDLDMLVEFSRTPTVFEFIRLEQELSALLDVRVEMIMRSALRPPVGEYIHEDATPI